MKGFHLYKTFLMVLAALALAVPSAALAQGSSPTQDTYRSDTDVLGEVGSVDEEAPAAAPSESSPAAAAPSAAAAQPVATGGGSLPFTGTDALLLGAGGVVLLGMGLTIRRFSRSIA